MSLIEVEGLSKFYGSQAAVQKVSFKINEGEIIGLLGLNGAGKSTILKILASLLLPSAGSAAMAGFSVESDSKKVRELIGYLPDRPPLYDDMRVVAYLRYVAKLKNVHPEHVDARLADVLDKTNLNDVAWSPLGELSHGFRQRVGIAQALVHNPPIIILDEPINGLDPVQIVEMRDLILSLRGKHTVILSSHILSEITKTCDRILIIDKGRLVAEGQQADLQRTHTRGFKVVVEVQGKVPRQDLLRIPGLAISGETSNPDTGSLIIKFDCESDLRSHIAQVLINSGASLLEMRRDRDGLEEVFMSLVKSSELN